MSKLVKLQRSVEVIHDRAVECLKKTGVDQETRKALGAIAEEAHELCQMLATLIDHPPSKTEQKGAIKAVMNFLSKVVSWLSC